MPRADALLHEFGDNLECELCGIAFEDHQAKGDPCPNPRPINYVETMQELRNTLGWSLRDTARQCGVSYSSVYRAEHAKTGGKTCTSVDTADNVRACLVEEVRARKS